MQSREQKEIDKVLGKLQPAIDSFKPEAKDERKLTIERWLRTYIDYVDYFRDKGEIGTWSREKLDHNQFDFLIDIFKDEKCWSWNRFKNTALGEALISEKRGGVKNPIGSCGLLELACRYCVTDEILPLLKVVFDDFIECAEGHAREGRSDAKIKRDLFQDIIEDEPVCGFWVSVDRSGNAKLKDVGYYTGIKEAAKLAWPEGIEYFNAKSGELYAAADTQPRKLRDAFGEAIKILSVINCRHKNAAALNSCLHAFSQPFGEPGLFERMKEEKDGIYPLLSALIRWGYYGTIERVVECFKSLCGSVQPEEILSHKKYSVLLSSLSEKVLENPVLAEKSRDTIKLLWDSEHFSKHRTEAFSYSFGFINPCMEAALISWVIDFHNRDDKDGILSILNDIKKIIPQEDFVKLEKSLCGSLSREGRVGKIPGVKYHEVVKDLFRELENADITTSVQQKPPKRSKLVHHTHSLIPQAASLVTPELQSTSSPSSVQGTEQQHAPSGSLSNVQAHGCDDQKFLDRK